MQAIPREGSSGLWPRPVVALARRTEGLCLPRITRMHANGCCRLDRLGLFVASPYATLRVYRYAAAYRASCAGLHSASKLAPWSPACSHAYGSVPQRKSHQISLFMQRDVPPTAQAARSRPRKGTRSRLAWKRAHSGGRPRRHSRRGTAKPWIGRRSYDLANTHAHAPAFACIRVIRGKKPETIPGQPRPRLHRSVRLRWMTEDPRFLEAGRLCDCPDGQAALP